MGRTSFGPALRGSYNVSFCDSSSSLVCAYHRLTKLFHRPFTSRSSRSSSCIDFCISRYDWNSGRYSSYWRFDNCFPLYGKSTGFGAGERERHRLCRWPSSLRRGERERCERWCRLWVRASSTRGSAWSGSCALDSSGVQLRRGIVGAELVERK